MQTQEPSYFEAFLELARKMEKNNESESDRITAAIIAVGFSRIIDDDLVKAEAVLQSLTHMVNNNMYWHSDTLQ